MLYLIYIFRKSSRKRALQTNCKFLMFRREILRRLPFLSLIFINVLTLFTACSQFNDTASVSLSLSTASIFRALEDSDSSGQVKIIIELHGDFSEKQSAFATGKDTFKTFTFTDIPAQSKVYVSAEIYSVFSDSESSADYLLLELLYKGESEEIVIHEGENTLSLILSKVSDDSDDSSTKITEDEKTDDDGDSVSDESEESKTDDDGDSSSDESEESKTDDEQEDSATDDTETEEQEENVSSAIEILFDDALDYSADAFTLGFASSKNGTVCTFTAQSGSEAASGYSSYKWLLDGKVLSGSTSYSLSLSSYDCSAGIHTVILIATDSSKRLYSASKSFIVKTDSLLKTISIELPEQISSSGELKIIMTRGSGSYTFTAGSTLLSNSGVTYTSYTWLLDGKKADSTTDSFSVSLSDCSQGIHSVLLIATESNGGFSSNAVSFYVGLETTVGTISIAFPTYSVFTQSIKVVVRKGGSESYIFTVTDYYGSETEYASYCWLVDGKTISGKTSSSIEIESGNYAQGLHRVMAVVTDSSGNYASAQASFMAGQ